MDMDYSDYPTDDYKHECRTGPFEGFFVSSVEFCDVKFAFDDKKKEKPNDRPKPEPEPVKNPILTVTKEMFICSDPNRFPFTRRSFHRLFRCFWNNNSRSR